LLQSLDIDLFLSLSIYYKDNLERTLYNYYNYIVNKLRFIKILVFAYFKTISKSNILSAWKIVNLFSYYSKIILSLVSNNLKSNTSFKNCVIIINFRDKTITFQILLKKTIDINKCVQLLEHVFNCEAIIKFVVYAS